MMAFDQAFYEIASNEAQVIEMRDARGTAETFLFRELYCDEPGCDCQRVVLLVVSAEQRAVVASINYAFRPSRRRGEPQIALEPSGPQSDRAEVLLEVFTRMVAEDHRFRERLHRHYALVKQAVDGEPRPRAREKAQKRAAPRAAAGTQHLERIAQAAARGDGPLQTRFRKVLARVERLRRQVREWTAADPEIRRELATLAATEQRHTRALRRMIDVLDGALADAGVRFTKPERKALAQMIAEAASELLASREGDRSDEDIAALKALYNRHSRGDYDAETAADDADTATVLRGMLELHGFELGEDVQSLDDIAAFVANERERAQETPPPRPRTARQRARDERRAEDARHASKAVQDVYRALARALHPDHEQDPGEQARKSELMREVNAAYEAKDLLRLLELQLQLDDVDPERLDHIAEERLGRYCQVLEDQAKQLAAELSDLEMPYRLDLGWDARRKLTPGDVLLQIREDTGGIQTVIHDLERDLAAFADRGKLKIWVQAELRARRAAPSHTR